MQLISENLYFIEAPNRAKFPYCHCLLIKDEIRAIIDTSCGLEQAEALAAAGIDVIINSHFHEDHILNNSIFPKAEVWAHELDAPGIMSLDVFLDMYGFAEYDAAEVGHDFIQSIDLKPSPVHKTFQDNDILDFGKTKLRVIHTPGHTPGHCAFFEEKTGMLFSGDIDLSSFGPWYAHKCSDIDDFIASIKHLKTLEPKLIVSCHNGLIYDDIQSRLQKYVDVILQKEQLILQELKIPHTLEQLVVKQLFYGPKVKLEGYFLPFETIAIGKHLNRLIANGEIKREDDLFMQI